MNKTSTSGTTVPRSPFSDAEQSDNPFTLAESVNVYSASSNADTEAVGTSSIHIVGGAAAAVGVLVFVVVVMMVLMRRQRLQRRTKSDEESPSERGNRIYDEIAEAKRKKRDRKEEKKKKKQQGAKTKGEQSDQDQKKDNDVTGSEAGAMDTAPDIITAHDNESIYETLDGRRAARAKMGHVTTENQAGGRKVGVDVLDRHPTNAGSTDSTYDHLSRFNKPNFPRLPPPNLPDKRFVDPEIVTRSTMPPNPRTVHGAHNAILRGESLESGITGSGEDVHRRPTRNKKDWFGASPAESPTDSQRSSLAELARQSVSDGKRIVCQLTMVGVVENGKPVPINPTAASNAYFILEPSTDSGEPTDKSQHSSAPKFRIKTDAPREDEQESVGGGRGGGGGGEAAGSSDYFILEPLDERKDLKEFMDEPHPRDSLQECRSLDSYFKDGENHDYQGPSQCHQSASSVRCLKEKEKEDAPRSFRNLRTGSCPGQSSFTEETDAYTAKQVGYGRSYSSPQSTQHRRPHREKHGSQKKMDAEALKARIRKEMIALGFVDDSEVQNDLEVTDGTLSDLESPDLEVSRCSPRSPRNDYFILEAELDGPAEDSRTESSLQQPSVPDVYETDGGGKPAYPPPQLPASSPPPLPKRNRHSRSKSETPGMTGMTGNPGQKEEQGPVIVTLKKQKALTQGSAGMSGDDAVRAEPYEEYRPRLRSESGVLS